MAEHHFSQREIGAAAYAMVKSMRQQMALDPLSACKRRLMEETLSHFVRWQMEERNRGTPVEDVYVAAVALGAWVVANAAQNFLQGPPAERLALVVKHVFGEASGMLQIGIPVSMPQGEGREGLVLGGDGAQPDPLAVRIAEVGTLVGIATDAIERLGHDLIDTAAAQPSAEAYRREPDLRDNPEAAEAAREKEIDLDGET